MIVNRAEFVASAWLTSGRGKNQSRAIVFRVGDVAVFLVSAQCTSRQRFTTICSDFDGESDIVGVKGRAGANEKGNRRNTGMLEYWRKTASLSLPIPSFHSSNREAHIITTRPKEAQPCSHPASAATHSQSLHSSAFRPHSSFCLHPSVLCVSAPLR